MKPEQRRLARFLRLEKIRAHAKQAAAREAAEAESTLAQLDALASRTGRLLADYSARSDAMDGAQLQAVAVFRSGLSGVSDSAIADATQARGLADEKHAALALAERRRQIVEDRATIESAAIARAGIAPLLEARRAIGTPLE